MIILLILILAVSFLLALYSMKDFHLPQEIRRMTTGKRKKGVFIVYKDKVSHYR